MNKGSAKGGLAFLNKKNWHTARIQNIEKVWLAEQKAKQEEQRMKELQKKLEEERAIEELRRVQAAAGLIRYGHFLLVAVLTHFSNSSR